VVTRLCLAPYVKKEGRSVHQTLQEYIEDKEEAQHDGKALQKALLFRCDLHLRKRMLLGNYITRALEEHPKWNTLRRHWKEGTRRTSEV